MPRGEIIQLKRPRDGFVFDAYRVAPADARQGGLVLIQEVFGVTEHIKDLADSFADAGYEVVAPSMYDRQERGFTTGYEGEGLAKAVKYSNAAPWDEVAADLQAAIDALSPPVFAAGFCW